MGTVVVLGSLITDLVARAPRFPYPGEALIGNEFDTFLGGKGINQAIAARRLGADVTLIGRVGTDQFGDGFFPVLEQEGIAGTFVERDPEHGTGVSLITIAEESGQNTIVALPRANLEVPAETVERALNEALAKRTDNNQQPAVFLTQCETSRISYQTGLQRAREAGMLTILNAAPIPREPLSNQLLSLVDIIVVNETEAAALSQIAIGSTENATTAAVALLEHGPRHVIITLGSEGSLWMTRTENKGEWQHRLFPAFPVKAIDSTAAGDTFCGALAAQLASGVEIEDAIYYAGAAGAITVTRRGAIAALPHAAEVEALLREK